jgi:hypothetical protein
MMTFDTSLVGYDGDRAAAFYDRLIDAVRRTPAVQSATLASTTPMGFTTLLAVDSGFSEPDNVQLARISIPAGQVPEPERVVRMQQAMLQGLAAFSVAPRQREIGIRMALGAEARAVRRLFVREASR